MSSRSFRVFGTRKDLENIFKEFQNSNTIKYYKCGNYLCQTFYFK